DGLAAAGPARAAELDIVLVDDTRQRALNRDWRGQDKPTNVLSFSQTDEPDVGDTKNDSAMPLLLGDVVLAAGTIATEALAQGKTVGDHVSHLVIHGVLHLLGFDHDAPCHARRMESLETALLEGLGIDDPYRLRPAPTHKRTAARPVGKRRPVRRDQMRSAAR
ncbi:MAG: rRNA maturation RNase YbeY, partial [Dongiaceae bacterium]